MSDYYRDPIIERHIARQAARDAMMEAAREAAKNLPPSSIETPDDLAELVIRYNERESEQKAALEQLMGYCLQGGASRVEFSSGAVSSNIRTVDRADIAVNRFVDPHCAFITRIA